MEEDPLKILLISKEEIELRKKSGKLLQGFKLSKRGNMRMNKNGKFRIAVKVGKRFKLLDDKIRFDSVSRANEWALYNFKSKKEQFKIFEEKIKLDYQEINP